MLASKQVDGVDVAEGGLIDKTVPAQRGGQAQHLGGEPESNAARLGIAVARLSRRLRPTVAAGSLTSSEIDVLIAAARRGPIRLSDLASFAGLNPTMLSRLVPKLEEAGLIRRLGDEADRRVCRVEATARGASLLARVRSERNDTLSRQLAQLGRNEREAVIAALPGLEQLAERLNDLAATARGEDER
jgi:DNA-binding MarR family transcriptional regulator